MKPHVTAVELAIRRGFVTDEAELASMQFALEATRLVGPHLRDRAMAECADAWATPESTFAGWLAALRRAFGGRQGAVGGGGRGAGGRRARADLAPVGGAIESGAAGRGGGFVSAEEAGAGAGASTSAAAADQVGVYQRPVMVALVPPSPSSEGRGGGSLASELSDPILGGAGRAAAAAARAAWKRVRSPVKALAYWSPKKRARMPAESQEGDESWR